MAGSGAAGAVDSGPRTDGALDDAGEDAPVDSGLDEAGAGPDSGGCMPVGGAGHALSGTLAYLEDDTFTVTSPYSGTARLSIEGFDCTVIDATYDAATEPSFRIDGLAAGQLWLRRSQLAGPREVLPTLSPITTDSNPTDIEFSFVPAALLDGILADAGQTRDPARGHVIVHAVREGPFGLMPAPGVVASGPAPSAVLYNAGSSWSANQGATGLDGFAVLANIAAPAFPGDWISLELSGATFTPVAAAGAVTFFVVLVS